MAGTDQTIPVEQVTCPSGPGEACAMPASPAPASIRAALPWLALAAVLILAAFARLSGLDGNPPGLHGDEAVTGIEGERILREGWIGLYSPLALGQPTGPLHATALSLAVFGETIFALRFVSAVAGIGTVIALWALLRRNVDDATAIVGAFVLASLGWAIHFSRVAFPVAFWPLIVVLAAAALLEAIRRERPFWWALAGVLAGLGLYVYNAHPLPLALLAGFGFAALLAAGIRADEPRRASLLRQGVAFAGGLLAACLPMLLYAVSGGIYFQRLGGPSLTASPLWTDADGWIGRAGLLADRYGDYWLRVCCRPQFDGSDASGLSPLLSLPVMALAIAGILFSLRRPWQPWAMLGWLMVLAMPLASVLTIDAGARRTLVVAPFLAAFAGYGVVALWRIAAREGRAEQVIVGTGLALMLAWGAAQDLIVELRRMPQAQEAIGMFGKPLADASRYMASLPDGTQVLFRSSRWPAGYESRRFLAPDIQIEDRSREFGTDSMNLAATDGPQVFILMDIYREDINRLERRYPDGETTLFGPPGDPSFIAFSIPAATPPTDGA
jgi:4-amino-4-deoxy-L-arabinose transferase-like glycosyltransferase